MNNKGQDFIKKENIITNKKSISYDRDGNMIDDSCASNDICCQYIKYEDREVYYVKQDSGRKLYDPMDKAVNKRSNISFKMKTVGEKCFMKYMEYLGDKNPKTYLDANRISQR